MNKQESLARPVISAILEKEKNGKRMIFMQTRWKPEISPTYSGLLEIPAGGINGYENVYDALHREVKEETGLDIVRIIDDYHSEIIQTRLHDSSHVFKPFICQQVLETNGGLPWIGFVFRCEVKGNITIQKEEAKDPRWISLEELEKILIKTPKKIFSLQYSTLLYYISFMKNLKNNQKN